MDFQPSEDQPASESKSSPKSDANFPFVEPDEAFLKKKPVNLFLSLVLMAMAALVVVLLLKGYYNRKNALELSVWESGRQHKLQEPVKNDMFQPLRNNWSQYIKSSIKIIPASKGSKAVDAYVIVENKSPYELQMVTVSVYSLNWNYEASILQNFIYRSIKPQQKASLKLPSIFNRKDLHCRIKEITAPAFHFCYRNDVVTDVQSDPYYCLNGE